MELNRRQRIFIELLIGITLVFATGIGITIGAILASTKNIQNTEKLGEYHPALPSIVLDRNGDLITELFSEEKRDIVTVEELPKHLIYAFITREDQDFFNHKGFSLRGLLRAVLNTVTGKYFSGGSSITQQVAGRHYADRTEISIKRKLKELWYAFQLERTLTKNQILELYMNEEYFGHNTYGVEAASQFYFGHSAREATLAESALLVIQLASPAKYSPINNPNNAKEIQHQVLMQMVAMGYADRDEVEISFQQYWENYDYTRSNIASAYFENESKAPYFSEYVRQQLENMLYGSLDVNRDGFIIHTTLDLKYQQIADESMNKGLHSINTTYQANTDTKVGYVDKRFLPVVNMLSLLFNIEDIRVADAKRIRSAKQVYLDEINPFLTISSLMLGSDDIHLMSRLGYAKKDQQLQRNVVEGALITLDNETGQILAMVGGSDFKTKKLNRAVQAYVQPGSAFKPLYYTAAIASRKFTAATLIYDAPVVFWNDDGTPYMPLNFLGEWAGPVLVRYALAKSMNVPSIQVLDSIGFDAAINTASKLLGITDPADITRIFPRRYPLGLGVVSVAPIQMAKAFSTLANGGKEVTPIGITYVEDRQGRFILEPEKELRTVQKKKGSDIQIVSPQVAYIMTSILGSAVDFGTLAGRRIAVGGFDDMPMAGKTGTTQNWSDAWTVGFSPYVTTAIWFGFDMPGNSLGINQTGATAAGPVWAEYMKQIHKGLEIKQFNKPESGLAEMSVCNISGEIPTPECDQGVHKEIFLTGTEPRQFCTIHKFENDRNQELLQRLQKSLLTEDYTLEDTQGLSSNDGGGLYNPNFNINPQFNDQLNDNSGFSPPGSTSGSNNPLLD
ncbi:MAG: PBP1A family penicillin-binding protein [Spirochaetales bacterium]|nr:MAG: PBP1A family penicillin-binding protein [Spirochaetales bacterium]